MKEEKLRDYYEKVCGLLLEGNFPGKLSPVIAEIFETSRLKLEELNEKSNKENTAD